MLQAPLKFILIPVGSAGDVHPIVWLAKLLQNRGHDVVMIAQEIVADIPRAARIPTLSVGSLADQDDLRNHPDLWHPRRAIHLVAKHMTRYAAEMLPPLQREIAKSPPDRTILIGGAIAFAARLAAERFGTPLVTVHLQPSAMMSLEKPCVPFAGGEWFAKSPLWVRRAILNVGHWSIDRRARPPLAKLRRAIGISTPLPTGIMRDWFHSPDCTLCLFPDWYASQANDWPPQTLLTRFPLYDEAAERLPIPALAEFLRTGDEPIVITPGSANTQAAPFLDAAIRACVILGTRPLILTRYPDQLATPLPEGGKIFDYIPFSHIFPHAAAVIHHGGIGTTAQCLAAGIPQLLMPMAHDQPDNAARIKKFGVGDYLYPKKFHPRVIAQKLDHLLHSPEVRGACARYAKKIRNQMSEEILTDLLEANAERLLRVRQINGPGVPA